jgi:hypothetical protein
LSRHRLSIRRISQPEQPTVTPASLSGPLPPKGIGIILGIAGPSTLLVRLMLVPILLRLTGWAPGSCRGGSTALPDVRFGH